MGTDLDEGPPPFAQESLDRRLEEHRPAQVVEPVLGVHQGGVGGLAGDGGVEGELAGRVARSRRALRAARSRAASTCGEWLGVAHADPAGPHPVGLAGALELVERLGIAGGDHRGGAVHRRQRDPLAESAGALRRTRSGESASASMPPLPSIVARARLRAATIRAASCEREAAGDVGGGDLALGVADHRGRLDPEGAPQRAPARPSPRRGRAGRRRPASSAGASGARRAARLEHPSRGAGSSAAAQARISAANTGERPSSSTAIPGHWPPWPGKTNTGAPPPASSTTPSTR